MGEGQRQEAKAHALIALTTETKASPGDALPASSLEWAGLPITHSSDCLYLIKAGPLEGKAGETFFSLPLNQDDL